MPGLPDIDAIAREACEPSPANPDFAWQLAHRRLTKALSGRDDLDRGAREKVRNALDARLEHYADRIKPDPKPHQDGIKTDRKPPPRLPLTESDVDHLVGRCFSTTFDGSEARLDVLEARAKAFLDQAFADHDSSAYDQQRLRRHFARQVADIRSEMMRTFPGE